MFKTLSMFDWCFISSQYFCFLFFSLPSFLSCWSFQQQNKILTRGESIIRSEPTTGLVFTSPRGPKGEESELSQRPLFVALHEGELWEGPGQAWQVLFRPNVETGDRSLARNFREFWSLEFLSSFIIKHYDDFPRYRNNGLREDFVLTAALLLNFKTKTLNKCKGFTQNIIEVPPPESFQYWWEQLDELDYGRTELIYCISLVIVF